MATFSFDDVMLHTTTFACFIICCSIVHPSGHGNMKTSTCVLQVPEQNIVITVGARTGSITHFYNLYLIFF